MNAGQLEREVIDLQQESLVQMLDTIATARLPDPGEGGVPGDARSCLTLDDAQPDLDAWQIAQLARHPQRPQALDYIEGLFTDFVELHGDRAFGDDAAIVAGLARFRGRPVVVIGHQKGRNVKERMHRNFGMARPEGYRKALRMMGMAERFGLPLVTLIDTPGAFPGIDAEERGQSAAIGECIYRLSQLKVPTVSIVIGEGGSGGALAIGVTDRVCMLQYATYSVISPEGCASILWKSAAKANVAASALGITAPRLQALGLIDEVIAERDGGAHCSAEKAIEQVDAALLRVLTALEAMDAASRLAQRLARLRSFGAFAETARPAGADAEGWTSS
jgi:acetyl-CoA carboxylase carboxyl transferase subunit alpha